MHCLIIPIFRNVQILYHVLKLCQSLHIFKTEKELKQLPIFFGKAQHITSIFYLTNQKYETINYFSTSWASNICIHGKIGEVSSLNAFVLLHTGLLKN